ncbi:hypothetical protein GUITHDRAFT_101652 [Guillardia theta CCMP2712]|uniref:SAM domain-containing protein n=2 Tax=Guillardia theta TaxID=55529 RepID=L1JV79_GUITC|nr:hypothetical protein GUITHDRAFT_101652 [Guillardia theta CCMP2712]EKX52481.1 hypothetical protein GUITHDRAFT_101652 [Guillardia theta CCMP2712]|eukprot:XP_005839461.1 hypothetical protein GUITHDRAFT_101652 [Guillardia theta CCMP2712]
MTLSNQEKEKKKVENKCRHDPSQWRSSNQLTPTICTVMLGRRTENEVSQAIEHFSQVGQCQCGKRVILCKYCPLSGDKLAEKLPKNCGQRTPNPIIFDNRATKNAVDSHSNGAYHRYWKSLHDRMVSGRGLDIAEAIDDFPDYSFGSPSVLDSETSFSTPNSELFLSKSNGQQMFSQSPIEGIMNDDLSSKCDQVGSTGSSLSNVSQSMDGSVIESKNPTPNSEAGMSEDAWFEMQARCLRERNMQTVADNSWKPFPTEVLNERARPSFSNTANGHSSDPTKILPAINLETDYMSFVKFHGLTNGWPDFVFQEDFIKPSLNEVVAYAKKHKHLPGVIPEKNVNEGDFSCQREIASVLQYVEMLVLWAKELSDCNKLLEEQVGEFKKAHSTGDERELMMKISKLLSNIVTKRCIQQLQLSRPQGAELLQWMRENGLICFARVFAKNGLHSLEHVANLDQQDCENLTVSLENLGSVGKRIELQIAVQNLQGDIRAKDMNYRLQRFSDCQIPFWSAWSSAGAVEVLLTKSYVQLLSFVLGMSLIVSTLYSLASVCMPDSLGIARSTAPPTLVRLTRWPLNLFEGLLWLKTVYDARMKCPMAACGVATFNLRLMTINLYIQVLLEVKNSLSGDSSQSCPGSIWQGVLLQDTLALPVMTLISYGCSNRQRQLLSFLWIIGCYLLLVAVPIYWNQHMFKALVGAVLGAGLVILYLACKCIGWVVLKNQLWKEEQDAKEYRREWESQLQQEGNNELIARLKSDVDRIDKVIKEQFQRCFAAASKTGNWRLRSLFAEPVGRFSCVGKVRQCTNDFGHLFSEASSINDHFHEFMSELLQNKFCGGVNFNKAAMAGDDQVREKLSFLQSASMLGEVKVDLCDKLIFVRGPIKQPERAIQKCVRAYGRDPACLTDLVRASVVVETLEQVGEVMRFLERSSVVGADSYVKEACQGDADSEGAEETVYFRMTRVKNTFDDTREDTSAGLTLKTLSINLEVGWIFENDKCKILPVDDWVLKTAETHILLPTHPLCGGVLF